MPNLARLNDEAAPDASATAIANAESDASTIYHILGCLENFLALRPRMARDLASGQCLSWLMQRCRRKGRHDQNRGYAAELLAVLVQGEEGAYVCERLGRTDGIDQLLEVLSVSDGTKCALRIPLSAGISGIAKEIPATRRSSSSSRTSLMSSAPSWRSKKTRRASSRQRARSSCASFCGERHVE